MKQLDYPGVAIAVLLENASALEPLLDQVLTGWRPRTRPLSAAQMRAAGRRGLRRSHIRLTPDGFEARSFYMEIPVPHLGGASAVCTILADIAQDYFEQRPGSVALHCGAFCIGGQLVALTGPKRAGKSTLIARLTAEPDLQIFCDDILPLQADGQAVALGIAPRLRLPLPDRASPVFQAHVAQVLGPQDDRYGYVCAPTVAAHGTTAPLSAFVLLDRRADGPARLHRLAGDDAVHQLMAQNMADLGGAGATFAKARQLAGRLTCLRLVYADLEDAVAVLRQAFGGPLGADPAVELLPELADPPAPPPQAPPVELDAVWQRAGPVALRNQGGSAFLWVPGRDTVWRLNAVARAVWAMLAMPASARDLAQTLAEVFPDIPHRQVQDDTARLLGALLAEGFVQPAIAAAEAAEAVSGGTCPENQPN